MPKTITARAEKNIRLFYHNTEWGVLWESFFLTFNKDGRHKYFSIRQFASDKASSADQAKFMRWYLGAPVEGESPYPFVKEGPQDWIQRRKSRGWYTPESMDKVATAFRRRITAYESLRDASPVMARILVRIEKMMAQLDEEFMGRFTIPGLKYSENASRMRAYLDASQQLLKMAGEAQSNYAKSLGINFEDMAGVSQMMQAIATNALNGGPQGQDVGSKTTYALARMIQDKAAKYKLALPKEMEQGIIDVTAEAPDDKQEKPN